MLCIYIGLAVHGYGLDTEFLGGTHHTARDLATGNGQRVR